MRNENVCNNVDFSMQIGSYLNDLKEVIGRLDHKNINELANIILTYYSANKNIFIFGNGGSGSTASHLVCDFNKGTCLNLTKKFKVICLNDNIPTMLAYGNDISYESIFVEQLKCFLTKEDLVIAISGSGNSKNVITAVDYANKIGAKTIGLTGFNGGQLNKIADFSLVVPANDMQKVEDVHMILVHLLMQLFMKHLNK